MAPASAGAALASSSSKPTTTSSASSSSAGTSEPDKWQCPFCPYYQHNKRSPDFKRHLETHAPPSETARWVCCGVPVLSALELGVPAATLREARVFEFDGTLMLGGCRKEFSRRDALMRHLQREKGKCFGDAQSLYQRGNRETRRC